MLISAKIFNECIPVEAIADAESDQNFLSLVLPQIQYRKAGLDKKYNIPELQDLKDRDEDLYWRVLGDMSKDKVKNIYFIPVKTLLFEALCLYYKQNSGSGLGTLLQSMPCATMVDSLGVVKSKGICIALADKLNKATVDHQILAGDGSGKEIEKFLKLLNNQK